MNEMQGKNGAPTVHYMMRSTSRSHPAAMKPSRSHCLVDEADKAAQKMVAECETLLAAVRQGTEQIRSELREKMVEFATAMRTARRSRRRTEPMSRRRATPPT